MAALDRVALIARSSGSWQPLRHRDRADYAHNLRDRAAVRPVAKLGDSARHRRRHIVFSVFKRPPGPANYIGRTNRQSIVSWSGTSVAAVVQPGVNAGHNFDSTRRLYPRAAGTVSDRGGNASHEP